MRIIIQRVSEASVKIDGEIKSAIEKGFLVLLGIETEDTTHDADYLIQKLINLRVFSDADGKMNLSLSDVNGEVLIVSQFTLHAATKKGNRPSYIKAARPEQAIPLYTYFLDKTKAQFKGKVLSGEFGADMKVALINDGPVTIFIDSKEV
ncbi:MAG: D-tyrosyl-tRNA(Tyr) deacylase [Flavobacteriales bacterium]|nr:D-tyrosyl-tRNA(Tyr) deacylase [Flavobacteriales bacterium]